MKFKNGIDITGQRFGKLIAINAEYIKNESIHWKCKCDCGNEKIISSGSLRRKDRPTLSCGCKLQESAIKKIGKPQKRTSFEKHRTKVIRHALKSSAKSRNINFKLADNEIEVLVFNDCFYCGVEPSNCIKSTRVDDPDIYYSGLDRVDSNREYTFDNVVPCCKVCNIAKHKLSINEFYKWIQKTYKYLNIVGRFR